jgi:hypothetical protein
VGNVIAVLWGVLKVENKKRDKKGMMLEITN